jgi:hypothetical protein
MRLGYFTAGFLFAKSLKRNSKSNWGALGNVVSQALEEKVVSG